MKNFYILLFLAGALVACKREYSTIENSKKTNRKNVRVTSLTELSEIPAINATGKLASKDEVVLSFKTGGILNTLRFEEGDKVQRNTTLAELNLSEIDAQRQSAQNAYDKAVRDYESAMKLYRDTVGTLQQKQNAQTALDIAKSQLDIANFNRRYSVISAPFRGTVLKKFVEKGQLVSPGQPVYLIGSSGQKGTQIIKTALSDKDVILLKSGDKAEVDFDAIAKRKYSGTVTQVTEVANAGTGLYEVEIALDTFDIALKNGFIGTVSIRPKAGTQVLKIPMNALVEGKNRKASIFYTLNKTTAEETQVEVIDLKDDYFTIKTDALPDKAWVINEGAPFLTVNDSILIIR